MDFQKCGKCNREKRIEGFDLNSRGRRKKTCTECLISTKSRKYHWSIKTNRVTEKTSKKPATRKRGNTA
jgi:hypothetical protein